MTLRIHDLKTWPEPFADVWSGLKRFEVRDRSDRSFDILDQEPCSCCASNPHGCTEGPFGMCCPCCSEGREWFPYENQEAARVFAAATLARAQALEEVAQHTGTLGGVLRAEARALRASVRFYEYYEGP